MTRLASTRGWRIAYRWTPTGRRRDVYTAPDGTVWHRVAQHHATHVRRLGHGLQPVYLRQETP